MAFIVYDLILCVAFLIAIVSFLIIKRKKVDIESIFMFLYRTSFGLKFMDNLSKKHPRFLKFMSYVIIFFGYVLMLVSFYFLYHIIQIFLQPELVKVVKLPPIAPLIPYLDKIFKIDWLPPFYFSYWIIAIALVAICHEGFHGIFARYAKVKIKSTGFGFFWPLLSLLFFVEQDDKDMQRKSIFKQLTILAAGVFANLVLAVIFFFLLIGFVHVAYTPSGVYFSDYSYGLISLAGLSNMSVSNETIQVDGTNLTKIRLENGDFFISNNFFAIDNLTNETVIKLYFDSPAIKNSIKGAIVKVNGFSIKSSEDISKALIGKKPGERISLITENTENGKINITTYNIILGKDYNNSTRPVIGIVSLNPSLAEGFRGIVYKIMIAIKDPGIYYKANISEDFTKFIENFLWWLFMINLSVAAANMIPAGIFDGGRFFYLTVFAITKSKKIAENVFKIITAVLIAVLIGLMILWAKGLFFK